MQAENYNYMLQATIKRIFQAAAASAQSKHFILAATTSDGKLMLFFPLVCVTNIIKVFLPLSPFYLYV